MQLDTSYKQIWNLSYPIILGGIAQTAINITDSVYLSKVGPVAFDASAFGGMIYFVMWIIGFAFGIGAQILIARKAGEGKKHEIGKIFENTLYLLCTLGLFLFFIMQWAAPALLKAVLNSPELAGACGEYLFWRSWGVPLAMVNITIRSFYTGIGHTRILSFNLLIVALSNILLCYLFIFGNYGFPKMGLAGAALASSIAEAIGFVHYLMVIFPKRQNKEFNLFRFYKVEPGNLKTITKLSLPVAFQHLVSLSAWLLFFILIENLGEHYLTVSNLVRIIYHVMMTPVWGYFAANNTLVSNLIGQGRTEELKKLVKRVILLSLATSTLLMIIVILFPGIVLSLVNQDTTLVQDSVPSLMIVSTASLIFSVAAILLSTVSGSGNTSDSLKIEGFSVLFYLSYVITVTIVLKASIEIAWISEFIYWTSVGLLSLYYLNKKGWQGAKL